MGRSGWKEREGQGRERNSVTFGININNSLLVFISSVLNMRRKESDLQVIFFFFWILGHRSRIQNFTSHLQISLHFSTEQVKYCEKVFLVLAFFQ